MKDTAYLIIHGFGGALDEIEYLAEYLKRKGLKVHTVLLAGHGATKKELQKSDYTDWIDSVRLAVTALLKEYRHIVFLGFSMGGLISVHFSRMIETSKIVLINTPVYFWNIKIILKDVVTGIRHRQFEKLAYYKKSMLGATAKSGIDFLKILSKTKKMIEGIKKPTLIIQCRNDESVHYKSAQYIKNKIGSCADLRYYDGGCHQVFVKSAKVRDTVCNDIYGFLVEEDSGAVQEFAIRESAPEIS